MRLISCYIEAYGQIKRKDYTFHEGITSVFTENGGGKTTLASFIKAMFYGLKGYKAGSTEFCDREHFYPFEGGTFWGNLTFEFQGKTYKIERYFGEKNASGDSVKVYVGGEETDELGEDIGKAVFGVDEASFMRTVFIDSEAIEIKSTSSINAKLGSFLEGMDEEDDFDSALKRLEAARKNYQADRKSKNATELIPQTEREIELLRMKIVNAKKIQEGLEGKSDALATLKEEIERLNEKIVTAQEANKRRAQLEHYESLTKSVSYMQTALAEIKVRYPNGLPTEAETNAVNERLVKERALLAKTEGVEFSLKDEEKLARLQESFYRGIPSEESLFAAENDITVLSNLQTELRIEGAKQPTDKERKLLQKFAHSCPSADELSKTKERVEGYKKAKREYDDTPAVFTSSTPAKKVSFKPYALVALLSIVLCVIGGVLLALDNTMAGGVLLGLGGVLLIGSQFLYLNKKSSAQMGTMSAMNPEKQQKERLVRELEDSIKAVLMPYGYYSGNGLVYDFAELEKDAEEYTAYLQAEERRKATLSQKQTQRQAIEEKLTVFFRNYGLSGEYIKCLSDLRGMISEYYGLRERKNATTNSKQALESERAENRMQIDAYKEKYALKELRINEILEDVRECARLKLEIEKAQQQAASYKAEKGLVEELPTEETDLASLNTCLNEKQNERSTLELQIQADEMEAERLDEDEGRLKEAEERLAEYKRKHKLLKGAYELLSKADGRLKDRYVKPILDDFLGYASLLEKALGEKVVMTKNLEIKFERNGKERSEKHLSAGQRSICALCFRLALIKNMYEGNTPFLVLDDPFTALDKEHMSKVQEILNALSKEMQMVYFTCHESRMI